MKVTSITDAVAELRRIAEQSIREQSRVGFFAALYGRVTAAVKAKIDEGDFFEDSARMEQLDVAFVNRYFDALDRYRAKQTIPACWKLAFDAAQDDLLVLQHLYLGLNAHLLLDLGVAAAQVCPGDSLPSLRGDFDRINDVVGSLMHSVDHDVGLVSPRLHLLDELAGEVWAGANNKVIHGVRRIAWELAEKLAPLDETDRGEVIEQIDATVTRVGKQVLHPSFLVRPIVSAVLVKETKDVATVIRVLLGDPGDPARPAAGAAA